ncbi:uncharacterized protein DNG_10494 [Cephalotrichum gorgonifer]|uniref:Uncharacterized protein n=1 Tax=Cephalotrichum gorgonifer TaxID=2041049 RepID=A0AAE8T094_9PEZI|nr:uncharacterized protein DNG_10494 [Cephalotrichum gorgonifer]
MIFLQFPY